MVYAQNRISPRKLGTKNSLELSDTNLTVNPGQETRLSIN